MTRGPNDILRDLTKEIVRPSKEAGRSTIQTAVKKKDVRKVIPKAKRQIPSRYEGKTLYFVVEDTLLIVPKDGRDASSVKLDDLAPEYRKMVLTWIATGRIVVRGIRTRSKFADVLAAAVKASGATVTGVDPRTGEFGEGRWTLEMLLPGLVK